MTLGRFLFILFLAFSSCKQDPHYECISGACEEQEGGQFSSLSDCEALCAEATLRYSCRDGNCIEVSSGEYASLQECETACEPELELADIVLNSISDISSYSFQAIVTLTGEGGSNVTDLGLVWSESGNPEVTDFKKSLGQGIGQYQTTVTGLRSSTKYFVRAYAENADGLAYTDEFEVNTKDGPCGGISSIVYNGETYELVEIGTDCWFKENLRTDKLNDATAIQNITDNTQWASTSAPAWCNQENNPANDAIFGKLYNEAAVFTGILCPDGWHIATEAEMNAVIILAGGDTLGGNAMKLSGADYWDFNPIEVTNATGLSLVGSGFRSNNIPPQGGDGRFFWLKTSCEIRLSSGNGIRVNGSGPAVLRLNSNSGDRGMACRCVKD